MRKTVKHSFFRASRLLTTILIVAAAPWLAACGDSFQGHREESA